MFELAQRLRHRLQRALAQSLQIETYDFIGAHERARCIDARRCDRNEHACRCGRWHVCSAEYDRRPVELRRCQLGADTRDPYEAIGLAARDDLGRGVAMRIEVDAPVGM